MPARRTRPGSSARSRPSSTIPPDCRSRPSASIPMNDDVFQQYSEFYDLLYRDKDYAAESAYIIRQLQACTPAVRSVLEFGSGTGGHGYLLAQAGFDIFGIERSA